MQAAQRLVQGTRDRHPHFPLLSYTDLLGMGFEILAYFFVFFQIFVDKKSVICIFFTPCYSWFSLRQVSREWLILRLLVQTRARGGHGHECSQGLSRD